MGFFYFYENVITIPLFCSFLVLLHSTNTNYQKIINTILLIFIFSIELSYGDYFFDLWILLIILPFALLVFLVEYNKEGEQEINSDVFDSKITEKIINTYLRKHLESFLNSDETNFLISHAKLKQLKYTKVALTNVRNNFDKIFYLAKIPINNKATVIKQNIPMCYLKEGSWVGLQEFAELINLKGKAVKWNMELNLSTNQFHNELFWFESDKNVTQ